MNMMEKIKIPQVEINLSDWQGAGISERETKKRAMEVLKVDQKGWKKAKEEDKIAAKDIVYQNTDKEKQSPTIRRAYVSRLHFYICRCK